MFQTSKTNNTSLVSNVHADSNSNRVLSLDCKVSATRDRKELARFAQPAPE
jgi:hypothetical protein